MTKINEMVLHLYLRKKDLTQRIRNFHKDENGQGMSEYALLVVLVAIVLIGGVIFMRDELVIIVEEITTGLREAR